MPRRTGHIRDGVYTRKDRAGFWMSFVDAQGRRCQKKIDAANITVAKQIRAQELSRIEQAKALGFTPPGEDKFAELGTRFLKYQKARLTPMAYDREAGIVTQRLAPFFNGKVAAIRRHEVQR